MVRIKERYLLVNIIYPPDLARAQRENLPDCLVHHQPTVEKFTPQALVKGIKAEAAVLFGDYGAGAFATNLWGMVLNSLHYFVAQCSLLAVKYLSLATSTFILRCSRAHYQMLWSTLTFMDRVPVKDGRQCIFRVVRVSGTIRKAEEEAIRQAKRLILAAKADTSGAKSSLIGALQSQEPLSVDMTNESGDEDQDQDMADG